MLTPDQIRRIQLLEKGWERDWARLMEELVPRMEKRLALLFRNVHADDLEEIQSRVLLEYHQSACRGTILANFTEHSRDPVFWLLGSAFEKRAKGHLCDMYRECSFKPLPPFASLPARTGTPSVESDLVLRNLEFRIPEGGLNPQILYAGLQFFPRLKTTTPEMASFAAELLSVVASKKSLRGPEEAREWLSARHLERKRTLEARLSALHDKLGSHGFRKESSLRRLENQLRNTERELLLFPLDAGIIAEALGISANNASQIRRRFREREFLTGLIPSIEGMLKRLSGLKVEDKGGP